MQIRWNRVRELRESNLLTQAELARRARLGLKTIHNVEKGMNCRLGTMRKILTALAVPIADKDRVFPPPSAGAPPFSSQISR